MWTALKGISDIPTVTKCQTDGAVLQLHYTFTVIALITFFVISTTREFVGDPVDCSYEKTTVPQKVINTFCWTHTTYTIPFTPNNTKTGHPGVGQDTDPKTFRYHTYYQWVYFVLLVQALLFYAPRWLWLQWEGGKIKALMEGLSVAVITHEEKTSKVDVIIEYITITWRMNEWYARKYVICEGVAIANVFLQFLFLDWFFQGDYLGLGFNVIRYALNTEGVAPLYKLFPIVTMCKFDMYSPSAVIEEIGALCVMPLNVLNEKVYIFLWYWFVILILLSSASISVDVAVLVSGRMRVRVMCRMFRFLDRSWVETLGRNGGAGDWFLLYLLGRNIDFVVFKELMEKLAEKFSDGESKEEEV